MFNVNDPIEQQIKTQLHELKSHAPKYFSPIIQFYLKRKKNPYINQFFLYNFLRCTSNDEKIRRLFEHALSLQKDNRDADFIPDNYVIVNILCFLFLISYCIAYMTIVMCIFTHVISTTALIALLVIFGGQVVTFCLTRAPIPDLLIDFLHSVHVEKEIKHFRDSIAKHQESLDQIEEQTETTGSGIEMTKRP